MTTTMDGMSIVRNTAGALLFMQAATLTMDVYSALNSSPWTSENFGADEEKAKSCMYYVYRSMFFSTFYCVLAAVVAKNWWPIIGMIINNAYMYWLYRRALEKGRIAGSGGWANA